VSAATRDFFLAHHGSISTLLPMTPDAKQWVDENVPDPMYWGGSIVIEPRYVDDIVAGIREEGLIVN
jgi:hypothetical protein